MLKLPKNEPEEKEYFFALEIDIDKIKSAIWVVKEDKAQLLSLGEVQYWDNEERLLEYVDNSLSSAVEKLFNNQNLKEPTKIIFGLSGDWIQENRLLPEKAEILKKISQKLELTPIGFTVIPEAIVYWLKKQEGVPPTVILIALGKRKIAVSLVELGKVISSSLIVRSENLGADLTEGLSRLERQAPFPVRILLYDGDEDLEKARQDLINYPWAEEKINFLHLPKVEILASDFDIKAIVLASASQITQTQELELISDNKEKEIKSAPASLEEPKKEEEKREEELIIPTAKLQEELLGFIKGQDVSKIKPKIFKEEPQTVIAQEQTPSLIEEDLTDKSLKFIRFDWSKIFLPIFSFFKKIKLKNFRFLKKEQASILLASQNKFKNSVVLIIAFLILISGILFALYWYLPKASIVLFVRPQILQKDFTIRLDPSLVLADKANLILPAKKVETSVEGEKKITTTGTKIVGEKAKGEVTIYNRTSKEKTFSEGTELVGPNNLKFTLDETVTIASESAGSDYVKVPGKATVKVTASAIGSESNLASGSEFTVGNYARSDFVARNESSFSGGTSREVQIVAKNDQEKALKELEEELIQKALEDLKYKITSEEKLIEESLRTSLLEKNFDKKVEEEANQLGLKLKLKVEALAFSGDEFKKIIEEEVKKLIPSGFEYDPQEVEINLQSKGVSSGLFTFVANFKANLKSKFELEEIKKNLAGKKIILGKTYLGNFPGVDYFEAEITPKFPEKIAVFPHLVKRINIEVRLKP